MPPVFAIVFAVGPGELEAERTGDLLDAIRVHEPGVNRIVIADDGEHPLAARVALDQFPPGVLTVVPNPRAGQGVGWRDGLTAGLFAAFAALRDGPPLDFVLKLDTDSLVVAPFAEKIRARFAAAPQTGLLGTYSIYPDGTPFESDIFRPLIQWTAQWVYYNRRNKYAPGRLNFNLNAHARRRRVIIRAARRRGYREAESCQGGGYAISGALLAEAGRTGHFADPLLWLGCPLTEDIVLAITARACGFSLADFNGEHEPFGVKYSGLPGTPEEIVRRGFSIIHSVKNDPRTPEPAIRAFFRARRTASARA